MAPEERHEMLNYLLALVVDGKVINRNKILRVIIQETNSATQHHHSYACQCKKRIHSTKQKRR